MQTWQSHCTLLLRSGKLFGVIIKTTDDSFVKVVDKRPAEIILYESGDTVTENALFTAAGTNNVTVIKYASTNYMVQEVCAFLQLFGVKSEGVGYHHSNCYRCGHI